MRKIDWDAKLSLEDIAWVRQAGFINGEDLLRVNAGRFGTKVPQLEPGNDTVKTALGPEGAGNRPAEPDPATGAPRLVVPVEETSEEVEDLDADDDNYEKWPVAELEVEISARNDMENTTDVSVSGTGANGKIVKADLVKGLHLWDQDNPGALTR